VGALKIKTENLCAIIDFQTLTQQRLALY